MPCSKIRKTDRGLFDASTMKQAVSRVIDNKESIRSIAAEYNISRTTLMRYLKEAQNAPEAEKIFFKKTHITQQVFNTKEEHLLIDYILKSSKMFHRLSITATRKQAYELYASRNNKKCLKSWKANEIAGVDWFYGLINRHPQLSTRMPEATSLARACAFNRYNVNLFFDNLFSIIRRKDFELDPARIWNLDETSVKTVSATPIILAEKGLKQVGLLTLAERDQLVTMCACVNAIRTALPPAYIFPRVNFRDHMLNGAPNGSKGFANPSGWMNAEFFQNVLRHFLKTMNISPEKPGLLIMDNHESHVTLEVIDLAWENGLVILTFPPHCSHRMQPQDISVFSPFKAYYSQAVTDFLLTHRDRGVTIHDVAGIICTPFYHALTPENIQSGFRKTGIFPVNRNVFTDDAFLSSLPSDRPMPAAAVEDSRLPSLNQPLTSSNAIAEDAPGPSTYPPPPTFPTSIADDASDPSIDPSLPVSFCHS